MTKVLRACLLFGLILCLGQNIAQANQTEDIEVLVEKANTGNAQAQFDAGMAYMLKSPNPDTGYLDKKDIEEAHKWLKKAADQGHEAACLNLGNYYVTVVKNYKEARKYYTIAADKGHAQSQYRLADMYYFGKGEKDEKKAIRLYEQAAKKSHAIAQFKLANFFMEKGDEKKAAHWFDTLERNNDAAASSFYLIGMMYFQEQKFDLAYPYFKKAAAKDYTDAYARLGDMFVKGLYVEKIDKEAHKWYKKAADKGHAQAQYNLGVFFIRHKNPDFGKALKYFQESAKGGDTMAMFVLGTFYEAGQLVGKDKKAAILLYEAAAKKGHQGSKDALKRIQNEENK